MAASELFVHRRTSSPQAAAAWDRRQVLMNNLRTILGRAYPRLIGLTREPSWVLFEIGLPFLTTSAFVLVYRALQAPAEYTGFVVVGGAMTAFWLNVIWMMAAQLYWEKDQGNLELYFTAPMDMMAVLFGMAFGGMVASCLRAAVVLIVGSFVYGVRFSVAEWAPLLAVFFLTLVALYGLGMMLASLFVLWGREAWHMTQLLQEPMYFVSGLNFPIGQLGFLGALAIAVLPLAVGLDAMRQLAFAGGAVPFATPSPGIELLILVVMAVVFVALARICLRIMEGLARHEGRLSARGR